MATCPPSRRAPLRVGHLVQSPSPRPSSTAVQRRRGRRPAGPEENRVGRTRLRRRDRYRQRVPAPWPPRSPSRRARADRLQRRTHTHRQRPHRPAAPFPRHARPHLHVRPPQSARPSPRQGAARRAGVPRPNPAGPAGRSRPGPDPGDLGDLISRVTADEPAVRVPSAHECGYCDITAADCPVRVGVQFDA